VTEPRRLALPVLAVLVSVFALYWGRAFFVSLLMGILIAYALNPVVLRLQRLRVPRWLGATLVMLALCGAGALAAVPLSDQVGAVLEQVPEAARKISARLSARQGGEPGTLEKVQVAAREIENATSRVAGEPAAAKRAPAVVVEQPAFKLGSFVWSNSVAVAAFVGQAIMVMFLAFFLLLSGESFKRKFLRIAGPSLEKRRITLQCMEGINVSIQNFMFMLLTTNALLALLSWGAFLALGLENAGAWALAAGLLHFIPYAGPAVAAVAVGISAFLQYDTWSMAFAVAGASLAIATLVGMVVATLMTGKQARMNSAAVFVALLFWGWLWGVWGLLLAIPIVVTVKVVAEFIEQLHPVAELLRA
jgi:predicted PurR-regulated permease PerM